MRASFPDLSHLLHEVGQGVSRCQKCMSGPAPVPWPPVTAVFPALLCFHSGLSAYPPDRCAVSGRVSDQQLPASGPKAALNQNGGVGEDFKPANCSVAAPQFQPEALD